MKNVLKGNDIEAKSRGKYEQKCDIMTIRDLMNIVIRKIEDNLKDLKSDTEVEIKAQIEREREE